MFSFPLPVLLLSRAIPGPLYPGTGETRAEVQTSTPKRFQLLRKTPPGALRWNYRPQRFVFPKLSLELMGSSIWNPERMQLQGRPWGIGSRVPDSHCHLQLRSWDQLRKSPVQQKALRRPSATCQVPEIPTRLQGLSCYPHRLSVQTLLLMRGTQRSLSSNYPSILGLRVSLSCLCTLPMSNALPPETAAGWNPGRLPETQGSVSLSPGVAPPCPLPISGS